MYKRLIQVCLFLVTNFVVLENLANNNHNEQFIDLITCLVLMFSLCGSLDLKTQQLVLFIAAKIKFKIATVEKLWHSV